MRSLSTFALVASVVLLTCVCSVDLAPMAKQNQKLRASNKALLTVLQSLAVEESVGGKRLGIGQRCQSHGQCTSGLCKQNGRDRHHWKCAVNNGQTARVNQYKRCGSRNPLAYINSVPRPCEDIKANELIQCSAGPGGVTTSTDKNDIKCPTGWHVVSGSGWCHREEIDWVRSTGLMAGKTITKWWAICAADTNRCMYNGGRGCKK